MASIYVAAITGDGATLETAWRPSGFDGKKFAVLMTDEIKRRAIVYSPDDTVAGAGITQFLQAEDRPSLIALAKSTGPGAGQRTAITNWLTAAGYTVPSYSGNPTWWTVLHFIARQVSPEADLDKINAA